MSVITFEDLIAQSDKNGTPFQAVCRKQDGTYQASIRSKYATGQHNAFAVGRGPTAALALLAAMRFRDGEDPLS